MNDQHYTRVVFFLAPTNYCRAICSCGWQGPKRNITDESEELDISNLSEDDATDHVVAATGY